MKKFTLLIALMLLAVTGSYAQVSLYTFAQSNGTYVPITGGTSLVSCTDCATSYDSDSYVVALPTPFTFNSNSISSVVMRVDGSLVLGATTTSSSTSPISSSTTASGVVSALGMDLRNCTMAGINYELRWEDLGTEYVFQWKNASRWVQNTVERFDFQIRLVKASGVISIVYGDMNAIASSTSYQPQVGLRGATNSDYNIRVLTSTVPDASPAWDDTAVGTSNSDKVRFTAGDPAATPFSGLTYTYSPPLPCSGTPVAGTVTGSLVRNLCSGSTPATIVVTGATPTIPGIVYQWEQSLNGTDWADVTDGSGATTTSYTPAAFDGTTKQYRLKVTCTNSTEIAYADAVTIDNQIAPATQASAVSATEENTFSTSFVMNWTNGNGNRRMVVISDAAITDPADESGVPAITANNLYAGTGQQIVYDGTGTTATIYGLTCATNYFVKVYEYNRCGSTDAYSYYYNVTEDTNAATITTADLGTAVSLPVSNNFSGFTGANLITAVPGWYEAKRPTASGSAPLSANPGGITSSWGNSSVFGVTTARINLYYNEKNDWIISPKMEITADSRLVFDAAITNYSSLSADSDGMQGTDDAVNVLVSTDGCGVEWTPIYTFNAANTTELTNALTEYQLLLTDYIGQTIQIAFQATDGPVDDDPDYDFHIGNIVVEEIPACEIPTLSATTAITKNSATIAWQAPALSTPTGYEYVVSDTNATPAGAGTATTELTADVESLIPTTDYYVFVRTDCGGNGYSEWTAAGTFTTLCDYPEILTAEDEELCGIGTVTLNATATAGEIGWYTQETGGNLLGTGESYTTPEISETTSYWVQASEGSAPVVVGPLSPAAQGGTIDTQTIEWDIYFTILESTSLASVDIFPVESGESGSISVRTSSGTLVETYPFTTSVSGGTTAQTIVINHAFESGDYRLDVDLPSSGLKRNPTGASYPYTSSIANITGNEYSSSYYMCLYNWVFGSSCSSPRTEVVVTVTDAPEISVSDAVGICPGENAEISVSSDNTDYTYNWMPGNLDGATQTVTPTETTTYTVTATDAVSGCVTRGTVTVTVNPLPSPIVVTPSPAAVCVSSVQPLEITGGTLGGESTVGDGTDLTLTAEELTVFCNRRDTHKSQTIYTAADLNAAGLSTGTIVSIAYNIDSIGSSANNDDYTVKIGTTALDAFPDNSYLDETGFVTVFAPTSYTHSLGVNTLTFTTPFEWDGVSNIVICISQSGADSYYNAQTYYTNMDANTTIYNYDNLSATTGTVSTKRFNVTFTIEGSTEITWSPATNLYADEDATVAYTEGTNASTVYFKSDVAVAETYTVTSTSDAGCSVSSTVDVSVSIVDAPTVDNLDVTLCNGSTVADLMATGDNIQWYADETGGTALASDAVLADGTYYASQTVDGCESITRTALNVTLYTIPTPEVTVVHPGCEETTGSITFTAPLGADFEYSVDGGVNYQASPEFLALTPGDYDFVVRNSSNGCSVVLEDVTINPAPELPLVTTPAVTQPFCDVATGTIDMTSSIADYTYSINGVDFQDSPIFTDLDPGVYTITVMNADGCTDETSEIVITPATVVDAPTVDSANVAICNAGTVADLMATGDNIQWYADETGGTALASDSALADGTYYASQTVDGCESATRTAVAVTINVIAAPTVDNATLTICNAGTVADLMATGDNIQWYADETGGTALANDAALADGTYYASQTVDGCESATRTAVAVTINVIAAPTGDANQTITVADSADATIEDIVVTAEAGAVVTWYASEADAIAGENPLAAGTQLTDGATYYATQTIDGCESDAVLAVTVGVVLGRDDFNIKTFSYYPNPVQDVLNISYDKEITSIAVFNLLGQQVMAKTPNANEVKLDMSILSDGTYLVSVTADNIVKTIKVVKKQ